MRSEKFILNITFHQNSVQIEHTPNCMRFQHKFCPSSSHASFQKNNCKLFEVFKVEGIFTRIKMLSFYQHELCAMAMWWNVSHRSQKKSCKSYSNMIPTAISVHCPVGLFDSMKIMSGKGLDFLVSKQDPLETVTNPSLIVYNPASFAY